MHSTNKAFERYFQREAKDAKKVYQTIRTIQNDLEKYDKNEAGRIININENL